MTIFGIARFASRKKSKIARRAPPAEPHLAQGAVLVARWRAVQDVQLARLQARLREEGLDRGRRSDYLADVALSTSVSGKFAR